MAAASPQDALRAALELTSLMPPRLVQQTLRSLVALRPELTEDLLQAVDAPLASRVCGASGRKYLLCDYSRDGDSFRSPYSSAYDPPLEDGVQPSAPVRALEVAANEALEAYREAYYTPGESAGSVYMWDDGAPGAGGFAAVWLVKRTIGAAASGGAGGAARMREGSWDATHVFSVAIDRAANTASYRLTTTVREGPRASPRELASALEPASPPHAPSLLPTRVRARARAAQRVARSPQALPPARLLTCAPPFPASALRRCCSRCRRSTATRAPLTWPAR